MTYKNPTSSDTHCTVCGLLAATHPRCRDCTVLIGPDHATKSLIDGLCASCWRVNQEPGMRRVLWEREAEREYQACIRAVQGLPARSTR
jgi:hypothetical protein